MVSSANSECVCGDLIRPSSCGSGWCVDCAWCHQNRESYGLDWFCIFHNRTVAPQETCKRWEHAD